MQKGLHGERVAWRSPFYHLRLTLCPTVDLLADMRIFFNWEPKPIGIVVM